MVFTALTKKFSVALANNGKAFLPNNNIFRRYYIIIGYHFHVYMCTVGSRMKKDWVELITKTDAAHDEEEEQHWLLTCVRTNTLCIHDNNNSSGLA